MAVFPLEAQSVIANLFDVLEYEAAARVKANWPLMTLADRARTETAQDFMRVDAVMTICPIDLKGVGISRGAKLDRRGARS